MPKILSTPLLLISVIVAGLYGCNQQNGKIAQTQQELQQLTTQDQPDQSIDSQPSEQLLDFNNTDTSIASNGNIAVAVQRLESLSSTEAWKTSSAVLPSELTKNPHVMMGQLIKLTGSVYNIEDASPTKISSGRWTELFIVVGNVNSPIGALSVDFTYKGEVRGVHSGSTITCAGYFVGTYNSKNAQDSTIECLSVVGNVFKNQY